MVQLGPMVGENFLYTLLTQPEVLALPLLEQFLCRMALQQSPSLPQLQAQLSQVSSQLKQQDLLPLAVLLRLEMSALSSMEITEIAALLPRQTRSGGSKQ